MSCDFSFIVVIYCDYWQIGRGLLWPFHDLLCLTSKYDILTITMHTRQQEASYVFIKKTYS